MKKSPLDIISDLPGCALIEQGLQDYVANRHTQQSCLIRMARPRLVKAGLLDRAAPQHDINAELDLYHLLSHEGNQAHSRYNALIRELISFEHALDHRMSRGA
jgi:hypothetical protein